MLPAAILSAGAFLVAVYLWKRSTSPAARPGCGSAAGGCDAVLSSSWSRLGSIPVSALAAAVYATMFVSAMLHATLLVQTCVLLMLGAAAWFTLLQGLILHRYCKLCLTTHALATASAVAALVSAGSPSLAACLIAGVLLLSLTVYQFFYPARTYSVELSTHPSIAPTAQQVSLHGGAIKVDPSDWPLLGNPAARVFIAKLFDYTCEDCRHTHHLLRQTLRRYAGQLAILLIPCPLESKCNPTVWQLEPRHTNACEYARYALALWRARPQAFDTYDAFLFSPKTPPTLLEAKSRAEKLAGPSAFSAALRDPAIDRLLTRSVTFYRAAGEGNLPKLLLPNHLIWGRVQSPQEFYDLLERSTGLQSAVTPTEAGGTSPPAH